MKFWKNIVKIFGKRLQKNLKKIVKILNKLKKVRRTLQFF